MFPVIYVALTTQQQQLIGHPTTAIKDTEACRCVVALLLSTDSSETLFSCRRSVRRAHHRHVLVRADLLFSRNLSVLQVISCILGRQPDPYLSNFRRRCI